MKDRVLETLMELGLKDVAKFNTFTNPTYHKHILDVINYMLDPTHNMLKHYQQTSSLTFKVSSKGWYIPSVGINRDGVITIDKPYRNEKADVIAPMFNNLCKIFNLTEEDIVNKHNMLQRISDNLDLQKIAEALEDSNSDWFTRYSEDILADRIINYNNNEFFIEKLSQGLVKLDGIHTLSFLNVDSLFDWKEKETAETTLGYPLAIQYRLKRKIAQGMLFDLIGSPEISSSNPKNILTNIKYIGHIQYNDIDLVQEFPLGDSYTYYVYSYNTSISSKTEYIVIRVKLSADTNLPIGDFKLSEFTITSTGNTVSYNAEIFDDDIILSPFVRSITTIEEEYDVNILPSIEGVSELVEAQITAINSVITRCRESKSKLERYVQYMSLLISKISPLCRYVWTDIEESELNYWDCSLNELFIQAITSTKELPYLAYNGSRYDFSQMLYGIESLKALYSIVINYLDDNDISAITPYGYMLTTYPIFIQYVQDAIHFGDFNKHFLPEEHSSTCLPKDVLSYAIRVCKESGIEVPIHYKGIHQ